MPIISTAQALDTADLALLLERYAQLTGYSECALYGVNRSGDPHSDCGDRIWGLSQRLLLVKYLREAQDEIEDVVGYPLAPRWISAEQHPLCPSGVGCYDPVQTQYGKVLAAGRKAVSSVAAGAAVSYASEPAQVVVATSVTDPTELQVLHPGSTLEINASDISIAGGNATISIPRCRLVLEAAMDNPEGGLDYADNANFETTVDVQRVSNDPSVNAELVYFHRSDPDSGGCGCLECGEATASACLTLTNPTIGAFDIARATYANGAWTPLNGHTRHCYRNAPDAVRLYYKAGISPLPYRAEDTILRLAHAKMPTAPCGCEVLRALWARDTRIPEVLDSARMECPFGMSDGAWIAWRFARSMRLMRAGAI